MYTFLKSALFKNTVCIHDTCDANDLAILWTYAVSTHLGFCWIRFFNSNSIAYFLALKNFTYIELLGNRLNASKPKT